MTSMKDGATLSAEYRAGFAHGVTDARHGVKCCSEAVLHSREWNEGLRDGLDYIRNGPMARTCEDCNAGPGEPCSWPCSGNYVGLEAICTLCGQAFNPCDDADLIHLVTTVPEGMRWGPDYSGDLPEGPERECGGLGELTGGWF